MPGLSPLFPQVHCTRDGHVCQVITGEAGLYSSFLKKCFQIHHQTKFFLADSFFFINEEINAAATITALTFSRLFDLRLTYFLSKYDQSEKKKIQDEIKEDAIDMNVNFTVAGIAGVNPKIAGIGSVTFARYAVQVALQYEIDGEQAPDQ